MALRLIEYLYNRAYWLDEASLVGCIGQIDRVGLFGPMGSTQLAPPGFLAVEWLASTVLGASPLAYRLAPLLGGIAALFLGRALARQVLTARGELLAVLLLALTDDLIYYSAEVKQYSTDLALSLLMLVLAGWADQAMTSAARWWRLAALGLLGAGLAWWSHPLAFTLAAVGLVGWVNAGQRRDWRALGGWSGLGLGWVGSILAVRAVGLHQLAHRGDMWAFWEFAFPPRPIASVWDFTWPLRRLLLVFATPLNFDWPFGPVWSGAPAVVLALVGSVRLARSQPSWLARLLLPGAFALVAAYLRLYPFHGRLLLFWVPVLLIPTAAGLDAVRSRWFRWFLTAWLFVGLGWTAASSLLGPRERIGLNPYGDRRPATLNASWYPLSPPSTLDRR